MNDALITFLYVGDLDRSDRFYRGILGLPLVSEQQVCRIYRVTVGGYLGLCTHRPPTPPDTVIVTLVRDDVEAYCASLAAVGVEFETGPSHNERFAITHAFLRDPDGNLIEIQRFDDPNWAEPVDVGPALG
ncbi:MAG: VOC family protein [Acidimicrobiia bacterium]|nr:VOC family protein [Acidimicrobiia bacterium]